MTAKRFVFFWTILALLAGCSRADRDFGQLRRLRRDDSGRAEELARRLGESPKGISLAIADCDVFGGTTRGWSSWVLEYSPSSEFVDSQLREVAHNGALPFSKRFEAVWILWRRSQNKDDTLLRLLIDEASKPGGNATALARRKLWTVVDLNNHPLRKRLETRPEDSIEVSFDAVKAALEPTLATRNGDTGGAD